MQPERIVVTSLHRISRQLLDNVESFVTNKPDGWPVDTLQVTERIRKGMSQYPISVVLLARLAVHQRHQRHHRGVGPGLLRDALIRALTISEQARVHALITHPLDAEATNF